MTWVDLSASFQYGTKLTSANQQQLRDNVTALAYQDNGSPLIIGNRNAKTGLTTSNGTDTSHDIDIAVGECIDSQNTEGIRLTSALTKQIDANWAVGTNAGGFPSGLTIAADTWYHLFTILDRDTGTVDAGWDTSLIAANLLADATAYDAYRRIASNLTDGSSNLLNYLQVSNIFRWLVPVLDVDVSDQGTSYTTRTMSVPTGFEVEAFGNAIGTTMQIRPPGASDSAPSITSPLYFEETKWFCLTNTSGQVETAATAASSTIAVTTEGWRDFFIS